MSFLEDLFSDFQNDKNLFNYNIKFERGNSIYLPKNSVFKYNPKNIVHWASRFEYLKSIGLNKQENDGKKKYFAIFQLDRANYLQQNFTTLFIASSKKSQEGHNEEEEEDEEENLIDNGSQFIQAHIKFKILPKKLQIHEVGSRVGDPGIIGKHLKNLFVYFWKYIKSRYGNGFFNNEIKITFQKSTEVPFKETTREIFGTSNLTKIQALRNDKINDILLKAKSGEITFNFTFYKSPNNLLPDALEMTKQYLSNLVFLLRLNYNECDSDFEMKFYDPSKPGETDLMNNFIKEARKEGETMDKKFFAGPDTVNRDFAIYIYDKKMNKMCSVGFFKMLEFSNFYGDYVDEPSVRLNPNYSYITSYPKWMDINVLYTLDPYTSAKLKIDNESFSSSQQVNTLSMASLITFTIFKATASLRNNFYNIIGVACLAQNEGTRKVLMKATGIKIPLSTDKPGDDQDPLGILDYYKKKFASDWLIPTSMGKTIKMHENEDIIMLDEYFQKKKDYNTGNGNDEKAYEYIFINQAINFDVNLSILKPYGARLFFYNFTNKNVHSKITESLVFFEKLITKQCGLYYQRKAKKINSEIRLAIKTHYSTPNNCLHCNEENPKFKEETGTVYFCNISCQASFYQ